MATGSTSSLAAASDRRRRRRSTSASHHSLPVSPGLNSPSTTRLSMLRAMSAERATAEPIPNLSARFVTENGPCVLAYRLTRSDSGSSTGSMKAAGVPMGSGTPSASRRRLASSIAVHHVRPAKLTSIARRAAASSVNHTCDSSPLVRSATSSAVRGPSMRSRSATPSMSLARRSGASR